MIEFFRIRGVYCASVLAVLLCTSSAFAALCSSQPGNAPGDIMQAYVHFWDAGNNGFNPAFTINGARVVPYPDNYGGVSYLPDNPGDNGSQCWSECWPIQFMARTSNVWFSVDVIGGNGSGWHCSIVAWVIGHEQGPIKSEKKQRALRNADFFEGLGASFGLVVPVSCLIVPEPYTCTAATTGAAVSAITSWGFKRIAERDPWNPDFLTINYWPRWRSAEELGLSYSNDYYLNQMIGDTQGIIQVIDFILEEVDKYESCQLANVDCLAMGVDHAGAIDGAIRWYLSWYMNDMSYNAWVAAWIIDQNGGPAEAAAAMRDFAQTAGEEAWGFQQ